MAMVIFALMMAQQVAGRASRDGIFLSQFSSSALPTMVAVAAISGLVSSVGRARTMARLGPFRITPVSLAISGVLHGAEWILLGYYPRIAACVIYLHVVALGSILLSGFWSVMNESFDPHAAKASFGRISGMGTLGGLLGGLMAERVAAWFSPPAGVLLLAILHVVCAGLLWHAFPPVAPAAQSAARSTESSVLEAVQRYPFLLKLAGLVLAASAGAALLDFVFKAQAVQTLGRGAPLVRFFGLYYTATSLLIFLVQTFVTRIFLQHAGLPATASVLPAMAAAGSFGALFVPGLKGLSAVRGTEAMLRGSIYRSAYELFYTAVAPAEKRAVKPVIDVGAERLGDAVGAGMVSLFLVVAPGRYGGILAAACVCSTIAFLLALRLHGGYVRALEKSLLHRAVEIDPSLMEDSVTRSILMRSVVTDNSLKAQVPEAPAVRERAAPAADSFIKLAVELRSGDQQRVIRALEQVDAQDWTLAPLAIELLAWDQAMPAARDALKRIGAGTTGMLVDVLLDPNRDFTIRRRVPRVLAFLPSTRAVEALFTALQDQRFEVRFYSGRALYLLLSDHPELNVAPERIWEAVNRELSLQRSVWQSHRLLDSRDTRSSEWFFDDQLLDRADRNLEHLFTLLALLLPADAVRIAFRALHTDDRQLRGTAFEYLESATPSNTRHLLLPLLEAGVQKLPRPVSDGALARLMQTKVKVNENLKLTLEKAETRP
jgi:AAA family ATP:ADP antiporter